MKYGYFDDDKREYVIQTPKTPLPWINYLGTNGFFSLISNTSGGYCFYKDAKHRRILRYRYNNVPADNGGRYFYIHDNGDCWSHSFMPMKKELDFYECRHGMGYTVITGERNGIRVEQTAMVPVEDACELHRVKVLNTANEPKKITLFSFVEFCLWNAQDDMLNYQRNLNTGEVEVENGVIYHKTEYRERRNHYAFYGVNVPADGFDTDRDSFLGAFNGFDAPQAVMEGKARNSIASGWYPVASHQIHLELAPGEEKQMVFCLGYIENDLKEKFESPNVINKAGAKAMMKRYDSTHKFETAQQDLKKYWDRLLCVCSADTPEKKVDRMMNIWNPYQCMVTFNLSRSASYYESGIGRGMGFRDSNQDLLGFVHQIPERARERILDIAATQFEDGSAYHQYQPLTKKGNDEIGSGFNDDPLWLILGTIAYIKETGDFDILKEQVPFDCDAGNTASLLEHLNRSFAHVTENLGPHGLPLIGRADWNDCLNLNCFSQTPDEPFQTTGSSEGSVAESVMIAGMFVYIGNEFARLYKAMGEMEKAAAIQTDVTAMTEAVKRSGWDGEWFIRAYDAFGNPVGSKACEEGKIFIESQGFCTMAGIGREDGMTQKALDSVQRYLECEYGIMLNQPAYTAYHPELGEISSYPPGYKENAGIFCHNNPWIIMGEAELGRGGRAFSLYRKIAPAFLEDISDIHKTEPYVYSQMIAGRDAVHTGEAKNSWLTGTAAWNYYALSQSLLGIQPDFDALVMNPCIPSSWDGFSVSRLFRGVRYDIDIKNPEHVSKGVRYIEIDGVRQMTNRILVQGEFSESPVRVSVMMGK